MITRSSIDILKDHGKSFYFAGLFLPMKQLEKIAELYHFCRFVDDTADTQESSIAKQDIELIKQTLLSTTFKNALQDFIQRLEKNGVQRQHLLDLVAGAEFDLHTGSIDTEADLDLYCYRVAGVVGLMMNPLIGVVDTHADYHAVCLGKAMQLTNICRDILEDAQNGRLYLPYEKIEENNIPTNELKMRGPTSSAVKNLVKNYLIKADYLYTEGYKGLDYIPFRARFVIYLAGEVYRHIGVKIKSIDYDVLQGRTFLTLSEKIRVLLKTSLKFISHYVRKSIFKSSRNTFEVNL